MGLTSSDQQPANRAHGATSVAISDPASLSAILPTSVVPLTAIPTFIRPGEKLEGRVHFQKQKDPRQAEAVRMKLEQLRAELDNAIAGSLEDDNHA